MTVFHIKINSFQIVDFIKKAVKKSHPEDVMQRLHLLLD